MSTAKGSQNILRRLKKKLIKGKRNYEVGQGAINLEDSIFLKKYNVNGMYSDSDESPKFSGDTSDSTENEFSHDEDGGDFGPTPISSPVHLSLHQNGDSGSDNDTLTRLSKGFRLDDEQSTTTGTLTPGSASKSFGDEIPFADDDDTDTLDGNWNGVHMYNSHDDLDGLTEIDAELLKSPGYSRKRDQDDPLPSIKERHSLAAAFHIMNGYTGYAEPDELNIKPQSENKGNGHNRGDSETDDPGYATLDEMKEMSAQSMSESTSSESNPGSFENAAHSALEKNQRGPPIPDSSEEDYNYYFGGARPKTVFQSTSVGYAKVNTSKKKENRNGRDTTDDEAVFTNSDDSNKGKNERPKSGLHLSPKKSINRRSNSHKTSPEEMEALLRLRTHTLKFKKRKDSNMDEDEDADDYQEMSEDDLDQMRSLRPLSGGRNTNNLTVNIMSSSGGTDSALDSSPEEGISQRVYKESMEKGIAKLDTPVRNGEMYALVPRSKMDAVPEEVKHELTNGSLGECTNESGDELDNLPPPIPLRCYDLESELRDSIVDTSSTSVLNVNVKDNQNKMEDVQNNNEGNAVMKSDNAKSAESVSKAETASSKMEDSFNSSLADSESSSQFMQVDEPIHMTLEEVRRSVCLKSEGPQLSEREKVSTPIESACKDITKDTAECSTQTVVMDSPSSTPPSLPSPITPVVNDTYALVADLVGKPQPVPTVKGFQADHTRSRSSSRSPDQTKSSQMHTAETRERPRPRSATPSSASRFNELLAERKLVKVSRHNSHCTERHAIPKPKILRQTSKSSDQGQNSVPPKAVASPVMSPLSPLSVDISDSISRAQSPMTASYSSQMQMSRSPSNPIQLSRSSPSNQKQVGEGFSKHLSAHEDANLQVNIPKSPSGNMNLADQISRRMEMVEKYVKDHAMYSDHGSGCGSEGYNIVEKFRDEEWGRQINEPIHMTIDEVRMAARNQGIPMWSHKENSANSVCSYGSGDSNPNKSEGNSTQTTPKKSKKRKAEDGKKKTIKEKFKLNLFGKKNSENDMKRHTIAIIPKRTTSISQDTNIQKRCLPDVPPHGSEVCANGKHSNDVSQHHGHKHSNSGGSQTVPRHFIQNGAYVQSIPVQQVRPIQQGQGKSSSPSQTLPVRKSHCVQQHQGHRQCHGYERSKSHDRSHDRSHIVDKSHERSKSHSGSSSIQSQSPHPQTQNRPQSVGSTHIVQVNHVTNFSYGTHGPPRPKSEAHDDRSKTLPAQNGHVLVQQVAPLAQGASNGEAEGHPSLRSHHDDMDVLRNHPHFCNGTFNADFIASLRKLKDCGWYWGPLSWDDAEQKLANKPDGSFLVRDSSDDRYILSLSFRSQGTTHHTRIEHYKGSFSFYSQPKSHGAGTIVEFIEKAMANSRNGKFLYFLRPRAPGLPPAPVQLLFPISRFKNMRSLQHMCRFCILRRVRHDHIDMLPLPRKMRMYLKESQYYAEYSFHS